METLNATEARIRETVALLRLSSNAQSLCTSARRLETDVNNSSVGHPESYIIWRPNYSAYLSRAISEKSRTSRLGFRDVRRRPLVHRTCPIQKVTEYQSSQFGLP